MDTIRRCPRLSLAGTVAVGETGFVAPLLCSTPRVALGGRERLEAVLAEGIYTKNSRNANLFCTLQTVTFWYLYETFIARLVTLTRGKLYYKASQGTCNMTCWLTGNSGVPAVDKPHSTLRYSPSNIARDPKNIIP